MSNISDFKGKQLVCSWYDLSVIGFSIKPAR